MPHNTNHIYSKLAIDSNFRRHAPLNLLVHPYLFITYNAFFFSPSSIGPVDTEEKNRERKRRGAATEYRAATRTTRRYTASTRLRVSEPRRQGEGRRKAGVIRSESTSNRSPPYCKEKENRRGSNRSIQRAERSTVAWVSRRVSRLGRRSGGGALVNERY